MNYLVIPRIRVRGANIINTQAILGGPPVVAAALFAHALTRQRLGCKARGVALIHHAITPLGERLYGVFHPQQRRAAAFTFTNKAGKDYSSKNKHALSLQPTASAHLRLSLVIELDRSTPAPDEASRFLSTARFSGGQVVGHDAIRQTTELEDAFDTVRTGYAVIDRRDLLSDPKHPSTAHALVDALGTRPTDDSNSWLSATCVGYAAITTAQVRAGGRDADLGYRHAFAEPLMGMVQFRSLRMLEPPFERLIWRPRWLRDDIFVVQQFGESVSAQT